ncbi:MAG: pilus assembly protein N-terminal domain-containing protein [Methyloligellaceae bacterium]
MLKILGTSLTPDTRMSLLLLALLFSALGNMSSATAEQFNVSIDQARLLHLEKQSAAVIVGNPSIADVSVQNGRLLVVTGKSYGSTNVIVLDANRKIVTNKTINVTDNKQQIVQLYKGSMRQSYNCPDKCSTIMSIGDEPEYTKNVYTATSNKSALVSGGSQQGGSGQ